MKNMTKALIVGRLMVLAQTALANDSAFPGSSDEAGGRLPRVSRMRIATRAIP
jgi:hypothetical protein